MERPEGRTQSIPHKWNKQLSKAGQGTTQAAGQMTLRPKHHNEHANTTPLRMTSNAHTSANTPWPTPLHCEIFIRILKYITILWHRTEPWKVKATRSAPTTTSRVCKLKYLSITTVSMTHTHTHTWKGKRKAKDWRQFLRNGRSGKTPSLWWLLLQREAERWDINNSQDVLTQMGSGMKQLPEIKVWKIQ